MSVRTGEVNITLMSQVCILAAASREIFSFIQNVNLFAFCVKRAERGFVWGVALYKITDDDNDHLSSKINLTVTKRLLKRTQHK